MSEREVHVRADSVAVGDRVLYRTQLSRRAQVGVVEAVVPIPVAHVRLCLRTERGSLATVTYRHDAKVSSVVEDAAGG